MSETIQISCPHCGKNYSINPAQVGRKVKCRKCGETFEAGAAVEEPVAGDDLVSEFNDIPAEPPARKLPRLGPAAARAPAAASHTSYAADPSIPRTGANAMATVSLVMGLIVIVPLCSLLAVVLGVIALIKTTSPGVGGRGKAIAGISLGVFMLVFDWVLVFLILMPSLQRAHEVVLRVKCAANERMIGNAILLYVNDAKGRFPPSLGVLAAGEEEIEGSKFLCPDSNTQAPANYNSMTKDEKRLWVEANTDYIYIGTARQSGDPSMVVLFEKDDTHKGDGMNLLFGDGHVEWFDLEKAHAAIAATKAKLEKKH